MLSLYKTWKEKCVPKRLIILNMLQISNPTAQISFVREYKNSGTNILYIGPIYIISIDCLVTIYSVIQFVSVRLLLLSSVKSVDINSR